MKSIQDFEQAKKISLGMKIEVTIKEIKNSKENRKKLP